MINLIWRRFRLLPLVIAAISSLLLIKLDQLWEGRGVAIAQTSPTPAASGSDASTSPPPAAQAPAPAPADDTSADEGGQDFSPTEVALLQQLSKRRAELDKRAADLDRRELLLKAVSQQIDDKIQKLQHMQSEIDADLMKVDEQGDERLKSLVKIYETMKPQDAARIFAQMDMPVLLELLTRMKELKTAGILANMDPDKAREITVALAAKKELPPDLKNAAQAN